LTKKYLGGHVLIKYIYWEQTIGKKRCTNLSPTLRTGTGRLLPSGRISSPVSPKINDYPGLYLYPLKMYSWIIRIPARCVRRAI